MQDFIHTRESIDSLIEEVKSLIQKKANSEAMDKIKHTDELLEKLKQLALDGQRAIVAKRELTLQALTNCINNLESTGETEKEQKRRKTINSRKCCIYAIKAKKDLDNAYKNGKLGTFIEDKAWKTGRVLFEDAGSEGSYLPIIFADAGSIWELLYWAKLTDVTIMPNAGKQSKSQFLTQYSFHDMQRYPKKTPPYNITDMILDSTGEPIKYGFIKSYAICIRPGYLK